MSKKQKVHYISGAWCTGRSWQTFKETTRLSAVTCKKCIRQTAHLRRKKR